MKSEAATQINYAGRALRRDWELRHPITAVLVRFAVRNLRHWVKI